MRNQCDVLAAFSSVVHARFIFHEVSDLEFVEIAVAQFLNEEKQVLRRNIGGDESVAAAELNDFAAQPGRLCRLPGGFFRKVKIFPRRRDILIVRRLLVHEQHVGADFGDFLRPVDHIMHPDRVGCIVHEFGRSAGIALVAVVVGILKVPPEHHDARSE